LPKPLVSFAKKLYAERYQHNSTSDNQKFKGPLQRLRERESFPVLERLQKLFDRSEEDPMPPPPQDDLRQNDHPRIEDEDSNDDSDPG
jgi:hypothetical protein